MTDTDTVATSPPSGSDEGATPILLDLQDIDVQYGQLQVLFGISLRVREGARVAVLGTNGAGKSTLLRTAAGLVAPSKGTVHLFGRDVARVRSSERARMGLTLVEGGRSTFPSLTVLENLEMGVHAFEGDRAVVDERLDDVLDLFPQLRSRLRQAGGTLSGGEQQMVAVGRALMADPKLLMIDELTLGLAPVVMAEILRVLEELAHRGTTMLIVEQSVNIALHLADEVHFVEKGEIALSASAADLLRDPDLVRTAMLGG